MIQERKYRSHVDLLKNLKNCCRETFAVGFKYTTESNRKCHQMGWILVLIVSFSGVFFHCYTLAVTYFSYRVLNSVSHEYVDDDFFPSVTICNSQPVSDVSYRRHVNTSDMYNGKYTYGLLKDVKLFSSVGRELSKKLVMLSRTWYCIVNLKTQMIAKPKWNTGGFTNLQDRLIVTLLPQIILSIILVTKK